MRAPDYLEPVLGWRAWLVVAADGEIRLTSVVFGDVWLPRQELEARCHRRVLCFPRVWRTRAPEHAAPAESCRCGIYGSRTARHALSYLSNALWQEEPLRWPLLHRAVGRVALWGSVVECRMGWRAANAYPQRIFLPGRRSGDGGRPAAEDLAGELSAYGVPVELVECDLGSYDSASRTLEARAA